MVSHIALLLLGFVFAVIVHGTTTPVRCPTHGIDISGLDRLDLLKRLWDKQAPAAFFSMEGVKPPEWDQAEALKFIENGLDIDYLAGRRIKMNPTCDIISPHGYEVPDRVGVVSRIVNSMRADEL